MGEAQAQKVCFVTIGATAAFDDLIMTVLTKDVLETLNGLHYTNLRIQYGEEGKAIFERFFEARGAQVKEQLGIDISGFDFRKDGLREEMLAARKSEGLVISHAGKTSISNFITLNLDILSLGSGSILDALRVGVPTVVVPNPKLLNNHQKELAQELARQRYVVHGRLMSVLKGLCQDQLADKSSLGISLMHYSRPKTCASTCKRGRRVLLGKRVLSEA